MKRIRYPGVMLLLACAFGAFGQEGRLISPEETKHFGRAFAEAAAVNGVIYTFNRFVAQADYSQVCLDSIEANLCADWVWDQDDFLVNQIAHPYQGSWYFISGRTNGLGFYSSGLVSLAGSVSWEFFCENETPSKNDLVTTNLGGSALGEMFHRLYLNTGGLSSPVAILLSPLDALRESLLRPKDRWRPPRARMEYSLSAGADCILSFPEGRESTSPAEFRSELALAYGNPFGRDSRTPFSSFEQLWIFGGSMDSFRFGFFSDGFLRSWALRDDDRRRVSAGLSLHYDFVFDSIFNFSANSLGVTVKEERLFGDSSFLDLKLHLNWLALGASDNTLLRELQAQEVSDEEKRDYDMGTGIGAKLALSLGNPVLGSLFLSAYCAGMFILPSSVPEGGSGGSVWILMRRLVYERALSSRTSLGLALRIYEKRAFYDESPNVSEKETSIGLFIRRHFL